MSSADDDDATTSAAKPMAATRKAAARPAQAARGATPKKVPKKAAKTKRTAAPDRRLPFLRVARPDALDPRDRPFRPNVSLCPQPTLYPKQPLPVKHQGQTNACTGFGLSLVAEHLLRLSGREPTPAISPYMLYSMARRYDEFPGSAADEGSSLRGALKGWFKHGACRFALFPALDMPPAQARIEDDWWYDAVKRPLGAYYRVDPKRITDLHAALNEVGILYASCGCHSGWDEGAKLAPLKRRPARIDAVWQIPIQGGHAAHPGHAFAIVGYDHRGFLVQNSWGTEWGSHGYAILGYDDWLTNAMDCWVAQLGVVTADHQAIAKSLSLRTDAAGKVVLSASAVLRNREISPFVLNMGNNGALSNSGDFRTTPDDVRAMADVHLAAARKKWGLEQAPVDVCIYAHGGLVGEGKAATIAAQWVPMLYEARIFPVFLMWETGFFSTVIDRIEDAIKGVERPTGFGEAHDRWWNHRNGRLFARPGTQLWGEMKQNADAISAYRGGVADDEQAGAVLLYRHFKHKVDNRQVRMHLVSHSAGSIVASFMVDRLVREEGLKLESVTFMAPAVRVDTFDRLVRPHLESGAIGRFQQFHLTERAEQDDASCGPYRRSLLYLVRESFEGGTTTPILGVQKDYEAYAAQLPRATAWAAPGPQSESSSHGGFDDDERTRLQVLRFIAGG
jgi:hypothetical protein